MGETVNSLKRQGLTGSVEGLGGEDVAGAGGEPVTGGPVTRPLIRYHGGKFRLAPWIISHFPAHRMYVEPFGGGASVLLRKPRAYAEIYNDLDGEVVNLFQVARDRGEELRRALELTPFARVEFLDAWHANEDPVEQARRTVIRAFMGYGSSAGTSSRLPVKSNRGGQRGTGFRVHSTRSGTTPAHDWRNWPGAFGAIIDRLQGVVIENRPAAEIIDAADRQTGSPEQTLYYLDPPYVPATRDGGHDYRFELSDDDHVALLAQAMAVKGYVVISGYPSEMYDDSLVGWRRVTCAAMADGARPRTEVLWMNPACVEAYDRAWWGTPQAGGS